MLRNLYRDETDKKILRCRTSRTMYIVSYTKYPMMLVHVAFLHLLQDAFKIGVHHKWDSFFRAVIVETQLVVFARQPASCSSGRSL